MADNGKEGNIVIVPFKTKGVDDPLKNDVATAPENKIGDSKSRKWLPMNAPISQLIYRNRNKIFRNHDFFSTKMFSL